MINGESGFKGCIYTKHNEKLPQDNESGYFLYLYRPLNE